MRLGAEVGLPVCKLHFQPCRERQGFGDGRVVVVFADLQSGLRADEAASGAVTLTRRFS